jgi:hypothetical protein
LGDVEVFGEGGEVDECSVGEVFEKRGFGDVGG